MGGDQLKRILFKGDKTIWIVFFIICSISWVEVFSATSRQVNADGSYWLPIIKHTIFHVTFMLCIIHTTIMPATRKIVCLIMGNQ